MAQVLLTQSEVNNIKPGNKTIIYHDTNLKGFSIVAHPSGKVVYRYYYNSTTTGKRRAITIGERNKVSFNDAVGMIGMYERDLRDGEDPLDGRTLRKRERKLLVYVNWYTTFCNCKSRKVIRRYLLLSVEHFGENTDVRKITRFDIMNMHHQLTKQRGAVTANRWLATMSAFFNDLIKLGILVSNPAMFIVRNDERPRERVLLQEEEERLREAINQENFLDRLALRLLMELGLRQSEVLNLRWRDLRLEDRVMRLTAPKSGHPQSVPIPDNLTAELKMLSVANPDGVASNHFVFGDRNPRKSLQQLWRRVKKNAKLPEDVRTHDLRRTFGLKVSRKHGLHVASKLLRHSSVAITERVYAPLSHQTLLDAVNDL